MLETSDLIVVFHQQELNELLNNVHRNGLKISSMELFEVDSSLLPTVPLFHFEDSNN